MKDAVILTVESVRTRASTSEALITFALPLEQAANVSRFMGMIGQQVGAAFVDVVDARQKPVPKLQSPTGDYGKQAQSLRLSSFFRTPKVWEKVGKDADYLEWLRNQSCAYCGDADYVEETGEMKCEAAHVRRVADGAGTSIKPPFSAIPLCHSHHEQQHHQGEQVLGDDDWWKKHRLWYVQQWCWETLKAELGYKSWHDVPPAKLRQWAEEHKVHGFLPVAYLENDDD